MITAVTGATGHVGANLVRKLVETDTRVRVLIHDKDASLAGLPVERFVGDVRNPESLKPLMEGADVVYHLATRISVSPDDAEEVNDINVGGTANIIDACKGARVRRLVHFSSIHALSSQPRSDAIDETRPLTNDSSSPVYDRSKAAAEAKVRAAIEDGFDAVIVNPTAILGPYDYEPSAMGKVLISLYNGRLPALVRGGFNWVDVRDVVSGAMAAAARGAAGSRYLLAGHYLKVRELARLVTEVTGKRTPRLVVPMWLAHAGVPMAQLHARLTRKRFLWTHASLHTLCNHQRVTYARAADELDYNPRPLQTTLQAAFQWYEKAELL